ncbi:MAG: sulfatase-like hydrolase/transferase [Planctomycetaceae bacterium]
MTSVFRSALFRPRIVISGVLIAGVLSTAGWYLIKFRAGPPLNVILVTFDTTRADRLGAYGYQAGLTGAFDEFSKRGVLFERAFAPTPITLPSHATMLTGLYPPEHGLRVNGMGRLAKEIPSLPEILKAQGYDTGAFIAAPVLGRQFGLDRGFDTYDDRPPRASDGAQSHGEPRRDGAEVIDLALAWLRERTDRPFFCWVHLYDAHAPYDARPKIFQQRFEQAPYDAGVAWQIQQFERLTNDLKDRQLDSNTLVIVAGDHGEGLDEHLEVEHGMLVYNTTLHVPLVFVGPHDCQPGRRIDSAVSLVDLFPTVLNLLKLPAPKHLSGRSLLPAMRGEPMDSRDCYAETDTPFVLNHWAPLRAVISGRWKYIQSTRPELYDLENDPHEQSNLLESAGDEARRLQQALADLQATFVATTAQNVTLSEKERRSLEATGYFTAGATPGTSETAAADPLPDVKDFLPQLAKFENAKHFGLHGQLDKAIPLLEEIARSTHDFPLAELLLGDFLVQAKRLDDAESTYRGLLERRPETVRAHVSLARILMEQSRWDEAVSEYQKFLKEQPDSALGHLELAQALASSQKFDAAIEACREALRISPEFVGASLMLGRLLMTVQRPKDAERCFEDGLRHHPRSSELRSNLMLLLMQSGQYDRAIAQGKELVAIDPRSFEAHFNLGVLLAAQRRAGEALTEFRTAQQLRPQDPRPAQQIHQLERALKSPGR